MLHPASCATSIINLVIDWKSSLIYSHTLSCVIIDVFYSFIVHVNFIIYFVIYFVYSSSYHGCLVTLVAILNKCSLQSGMFYKCLFFLLCLPMFDLKSNEDWYCTSHIASPEYFKSKTLNIFYFCAIKNLFYTEGSRD